MRIHGIVPVIACLVATAVSPRAARAQGPAEGPEIVVSALATKLGSKPSPDCGRYLEIGNSITLMLSAPEKIARYGVRDMHEGDRVTVTRVGPDRLRVEVEELEPKDIDVVVTLHVANDGALTVIQPPPAPKPPAVGLATRR